MTDSLPAPIARTQLTLGILAGGRASRLGGRDKAWLVRDGVPQVVRWQRRFAPEVAAILVSANSRSEPYAAHGLQALADRVAHGGGPTAGLDALAAATLTPWLLTVPVDLVGVNDCLIPTLVAERANDGAYAQDEDGRQPLVALWRVAALRQALAAAPVADTAVHALQSRLDMVCVAFRGVRFGNLNTYADLDAAGIAHE